MRESTYLTLFKIFFIGSILGICMMIIGSIAQSYKLQEIQKQVNKLQIKEVEK